MTRCLSSARRGWRFDDLSSGATRLSLPPAARIAIVHRVRGLVGRSMTGMLLVFALVCSTADAQSGTAGNSGVHIDPGSPAAKQYAIPLSQARQIDSGSSSSASSSATAFGAGINPPAPVSSSRSASASRDGRAHRRRSSRVRARKHGKHAATALTPEAKPPAAVLQAANTQASSGGGDGSTLALLGGGVLILVLGGLGGTVLRRTRPSGPAG